MAAREELKKHGAAAMNGRCRLRRLVLALAPLLVPGWAAGAPCAHDDHETHVSGAAQCLLMRRFGPADPEAMVVWLHGDLSSGAPADYHFAIAQSAASQFAGARLLSVALVRPGYPDGSGESSSVALLHGGRGDHYTRDNVSEVGAAIERLRGHFKPRFVVLVGHSGGAATAAVLLGLKPGLADAAVLVACPCDLVAWRAGRREWRRGEDPMRWVEPVRPPTRVVALTGDQDDNTPPALARGYVDALRSNGVDARLVVLPGQTHNGAFRAPEVIDALRQLLPAR